jgi:peptidoglycan/LPS O-acetylase OafA/YrhL
VDHVIAAVKPVNLGHDRVPELDGFRALAIWLVLADHMLDGWKLPDAATEWMPRILFMVVSHGWLGVDVFFILSGFLITGILLDERGQPHYFKNFYGRRALRILPLALTCIAIWQVAYGAAYAPYFALAALFSANLNILFGIAEPHGPGILWSLAVEEHFYLLWPVAVRFLRRRILIVLALTIVLLTPVLRARGVASGLRADLEVYQLSWFRFDGLALGALLAIWVRSQFFTVRNTWVVAAIGLSAIITATILTVHQGVFVSHTPAASALRSPQAQFLCATAMVLSLVYRGSVITAPLRSGFARLTAKLSYCLYLIHLPLGDLYYWLLGRLGVNDVITMGAPGALIVRSLIIITVSYGLAAVSQEFLEAPFMRLRTRFT